MSVWLRVFGRAPQQPDPDLVLQVAQEQDRAVQGHLRGDEQGWTALELTLREGTTPLLLERYLVTEPGIRAELNAWAAWLETCDYSAEYTSLMERVIQTQQLFTLRKPIDHADEALLDRVCLALCQHLAYCTDGVYQIDQQGFFTPDGQLLLQEY